MSDTPKWYVTEYPEECSFAVTDGYDIFAMISGGKTVGDECDLANRIAKLPDLERERDEARKSLDEMSKYLAQATAQRDHAETEMRKWMVFAKNVLGERDKVMQNAKLLDIAQWFANHFVDECWHLPHEDQELHDRLSLCPVILKARELKAELDQLKEEVK